MDRIVEIRSELIATPGDDCQLVFVGEDSARAIADLLKEVDWLRAALVDAYAVTERFRTIVDGYGTVGRAETIRKLVQERDEAQGRLSAIIVEMRAQERAFAEAVGHHPSWYDMAQKYKAERDEARRERDESLSMRVGAAVLRALEPMDESEELTRADRIDYIATSHGEDSWSHDVLRAVAGALRAHAAGSGAAEASVGVCVPCGGEGYGYFAGVDMVECPTCNGTGRARACEACNGRGSFPVPGRYDRQTVCAGCDGTGRAKGGV